MWRTPASDSPSARSVARGFTLIEMMVSVAVLSIILVLLTSMTDHTSKIWLSTSGKIEAFQNARTAFDSVVQTVSQATLNTYYEYYDAQSPSNPLAFYIAKYGPGSSQVNNFVPARYDRYSDLHFISGQAKTLLNGVTRAADGAAYTQMTSGQAIFFQAPVGYTQDKDARQLDNVLNAIGFFVEFGSDADTVPSFVATHIKPRYRYRLVQLIQPSESLTVYSEKWASRTTGKPAQWFTSVLGASDRPVRVLADNILLLVLRPKRPDTEYAKTPTLPPLAANYAYDSQPNPVVASDVKRYQLPPLVAVTLVAIDEASAIRLANKYGTSPPLTKIPGASGLFETTTDTNDPASFNADMKRLTDALVAEKVNFRVFDTEVIIRASKWSEN